MQYDDHLCRHAKAEADTVQQHQVGPIGICCQEPDVRGTGRHERHPRQQVSHGEGGVRCAALGLKEAPESQKPGRDSLACGRICMYQFTVRGSHNLQEQ